MIIKFINLRIIQIKRELNKLGIFFSLFYLCLFTFAGIFVFNKITQYPDYALPVSFVNIMILSTIHINRKDKKFVASIVLKPGLIFFVEYLILSIPFLAIILFSNCWYYSILLLPVIYAIILINYTPKHKTKLTGISKIIPLNNFEWIAGLRKYFWIILFLYSVALTVLFTSYVSLFFLWLILGIIASFYQECEPVNILQLDELPAKHFIIKKLKNHISIYLIFAFPIIAGYCIFNIETAWVALIFYFLTTINICFFLLLKYSFYKPSKFIETKIFVAIAQFGIIFPFLVLVPLIMCFRQYKIAKINLESYLNAYN